MTQVPQGSIRVGLDFAVVLTLALLLPRAANAQVSPGGLSGVRGQRFANEDLFGFDPEPGDHFAMALAVGDFNGDGAADLATGIPDDDGIFGFGTVDLGAVVVRYGIVRAGLATGLADTFLRQTSGLDPADDGDRYGAALAACDFNGDGFDDLAIGVPGEDHLGHTDTGAVQIHYGSAAGIHVVGDNFYTQSTDFIPGDPEDLDHFGAALACGDFNQDGFADLAIGVPQETFEGIGFHIFEGMVDLIPGSASGLDPIHATELDQDSPGMQGEADILDYFGFALAVGDFDADGFDDLAIGVPGETDDDSLNKGSVQAVFGSASGLTSAGNQLFSHTGLNGASEEGDQFGFTLASGNFDGDIYADLAIGAPFANLGSANEIVDAGQILIVFGEVNGLDLSVGQFWTQDAVFGAGASAANDLFGYSLAAGDFDHDGVGDLAIGAPGELSLLHPDDGAATILMGATAFGLNAARHLSIAAGINGFPGVPLQSNRNFAQALAVGDFDGDGYADLALGAPLEDENGLADVGAEVVLYGALFADGFDAGDRDSWSASVP